MSPKNSRKFKAKLKAVIISLLIIIPAAVILAVVLWLKPGKIKANNMTLITIVTPEGEQLTYDDQDTFNLYAQIFGAAGDINTPAHEISSYKVFELTLTGTSAETKCDMLLTDAPEDCLLRVSRDGQTVYQNIPPEYAAQILTNDDFRAAYTYYLPPSAQISIGEKSLPVMPSQLEWAYRRSDGVFCPTQPDKYISDQPVSLDYDPVQGMDLSFDLAPDSLSVQIYDGENSVYSGTYGSEEYRSFSYNKKALLNYVFTAEWYETENAKYHGKAVYNVEINYIVPPSGLLSSSKITQGEFLAVSVYNASPDEQLTVENETLDFYPNGEARLLLYPAYIGGFVGQKLLTINDSQGFKISNFIEVALPEDTPPEYLLHESLPSGLYVADYSSPALVQIAGSLDKSGEKLWEGEFIMPTENGTALISYGTPIVQNEADVGYSSFMLLQTPAADVKAAASGKVAFSGVLQPYGNVIVIDHGLGVATFYSNLDSLAFSAGDSVSAGDVLGVLNVTAGAALQYGAMVNGKFIDPAKLNACLETARLI